MTAPPTVRVPSAPLTRPGPLARRRKTAPTVATSIWRQTVLGKHSLTARLAPGGVAGKGLREVVNPGGLQVPTDRATAALAVGWQPSDRACILECRQVSGESGSGCHIELVDELNRAESLCSQYVQDRHSKRCSEDDDGRADIVRQVDVGVDYAGHRCSLKDAHGLDCTSNTRTHVGCTTRSEPYGIMQRTPAAGGG